MPAAVPQPTQTRRIAPEQAEGAQAVTKQNPDCLVTDGLPSGVGFTLFEFLK